MLVKLAIGAAAIVGVVWAARQVARVLDRHRHH